MPKEGLRERALGSRILTRQHLSNPYYLTCSGELWESLASALTLPRWDSAAPGLFHKQVVLIDSQSLF